MTPDQADPIEDVLILGGQAVADGDGWLIPGFAFFFALRHTGILIGNPVVEFPYEFEGQEQVGWDNGLILLRLPRFPDEVEFCGKIMSASGVAIRNAEFRSLDSMIGGNPLQGSLLAPEPLEVRLDTPFQKLDWRLKGGQLSTDQAGLLRLKLGNAARAT